MIGAVQQKLKPLTSAIKAIDVLLEQFAGFVKSITQKAEGETFPRFVPAVLCIYIQDQAEGIQVSHLLYLQVLSSGGEAITKRSFLAKWRGLGNTRFIDGASADFVLVALDGQILAADTCLGLGHLDYGLGKKEQEFNLYGIKQIPLSNG